jgi:hypothetical protein
MEQRVAHRILLRGTVASYLRVLPQIPVLMYLPQKHPAQYKKGFPLCILKYCLFILTEYRQEII